MKIQATQRRLRAGLYGAGSFGRFIVECLRLSSDAYITEIASRTPQRAARLAVELGVQKTAQNYEQLLASENVDFIIIATPPAHHASHALSALAAGKHVLVEKPLATNAFDAQRVVTEARRRNLILGVDFPMPYTQIARTLGAVVNSGVSGKPQRVMVENIASCQGLGDEHWFWDMRQSGGIFIEHGVHFFDWCGALLEAPRNVRAWTAGAGLRQNRVFAAVAHEAALATYYHAFVATPQNERTRCVVSFDDVDAFVDGWIPIELRLVGPGANRAAAVVRGCTPSLREKRGPDGEAAFDAGPKEKAYALGIRDLMADFCRAIVDRSHRRVVDETRAVVAVRVAEASRLAAETGVTQSIDAE